MTITTDLRPAHLELARGADGERRGRAFCRSLSDVTDEWIVELFDAAVAGHDTGSARFALVAVGGYGRGELAPASDVDLLLVHDAKPKNLASIVEPVASAIWYPLWDAGVRLGHAVRRLRELVALVRDDLDSATSMLTARALAGDEELANEAIEAAHQAWSKRSDRFLHELLEGTRARQRSAGEVAYQLEPDLKDGHGGLRDVQALWWATASGLDLCAEDQVVLDRCYDALLRARVSLHLATGRPGDVLRLEDQDAVATEGGWSDADDLMASVARAGRSIAWVCDENWGRLVAEGADREDRRVAPGIVLRAGEIELADGTDPAADPTLALRAAVAAARHRCRIARSTLDRLHDDVGPWPREWPLGATDELVALLLEGHDAIPVLESLDQRDLLARFLPEWATVRSKPQRNAYHRFTVDRHLWEAAANAAELVDQVGRPDLLVLGALFHDLGKGYPGDHTEIGIELVERIAPRMGLTSRETAILVAMVEHHLLLPDIAVRRDLSDAATIQQVADAVGTVEVLDLLHALTVADSKATGPSAWGDWKEGLVDELVERVRHVLGGGDVAEATWRLFPDAVTLEKMAAGAVDVSIEPGLVTVVNPDAAGTFSQVAGVLSLHGLDVISARAHSDEQGMAAAQFRVDSDAVDRAAFCADLHKALARQLAIEARLAERAQTYRRRRRRTQARLPDAPTVTFDDGASSNATVVEVHGPTSIGILYRITRALAELGLDIRHASVQTIGMEVVDTFYVRTNSGALVSDQAHRREIIRALEHAVPDPRK